MRGEKWKRAVWVGGCPHFHERRSVWRDVLARCRLRAKALAVLHPATAFASATECLLAASTHTLSTQVFLALLGRPSVEGQVELQLPRPEPVAEVEALVEQLRRVHSL